MGIGDSNYSKFMFIPKLINDNLNRIGAIQFVQRGEGDDAYGLEEIVEPWIENLVGEMKKNLNLFQTKLLNNTNVAIEENKPELASLVYNNIEDYENFKVKKIVKISGNKATKEIYKLTLQQKDKNETLMYNPGAHISVLPRLSKEKCSLISKHIDLLDKASDLSLENQNLYKISNKIKDNFPCFNLLFEKNKSLISKIDLISYLLDFSTVIKKNNLIKLVEKTEQIETNLFKNFTKNLKKLLDNFDLTVKNNITFYDIFLGLEKLSLIENLKFPTTSFSNLLLFKIEELFDIFGCKFSRKYSISTSQSTDNCIEIIFSLVNFKYSRTLHINEFIEKKNIIYFEGETTHYLKNLKIDEGMYIEIKSNFDFPREDHLNLGKPLTFIANGTGVTPFLSYLKSLSRDNLDLIGDFTLIFGIRSNQPETNESIEENYIENFGLEINQNREGEQRRFKYITCISQCANEDDDLGCGVWRNVKINFEHVQDIVIDRKFKIYDDLILNDGYLMICGDLNLILNDIFNILISAIKIKKQVSKEEAKTILESLKTSGKILVEKWN